MNKSASTLRRDELSSNPFDQLSIWLQEALDAYSAEPTAMVLATATKTGMPSTRTVLLKRLDTGLVFFTHYTSRKSRELEANPHASVVFLWKELDRQVIVEGVATKVSEEESDTYFALRARGSQIGCWTSKQGSVVESRQALDDAYDKTEKRFEGQDIPRPPHWGGWRLTPTRFEFWQGRQYRLHDRFQYLPEGEGWLIERLSP